MWRQLRSYRPGAGRLYLALIVSLMAGLSGCATRSMVSFRCEPSVNEGIVLTIDLIEVSEEEVRQIQQVGADWFYSGLRRQMSHRIKTVTVSGGCNNAVDLSELGAKEKYLSKKKGPGTLAVIAEYQSRYSDSHMRFLRRGQWKGKTVVIRVHGSFLSIDG